MRNKLKELAKLLHSLSEETLHLSEEDELTVVLHPETLKALIAEANVIQTILYNLGR